MNPTTPSDLHDFVRNNAQPLLNELEIFSILYSGNAINDIQNIFTNLELDVNFINWQKSPSWSDDLSEELNTKMVVLAIDQLALESSWTEILNWKNRYNQELSYATQKETSEITNPKIFLLVQISNPSGLEIGNIKKISDSIFNLNVDY